jgi:hypothetical protein
MSSEALDASKFEEPAKALVSSSAVSRTPNVPLPFRCLLLQMRPRIETRTACFFDCCPIARPKRIGGVLNYYNRDAA